MQDSSEIMILSLQFGGLQIPPTDDGFQPMKIQYPNLIKWLEQKINSNQLLPVRVKDYYTDCRNQFVQIRQTPKKLTDGNEKAIAFLEANIANGRIAPQVKCELKPLLFGHHALQIEAANDADLKIQAHMAAFQTQCQAEMLDARKDLKAKLENFDIKSECEKYAQDKWIALCGGSDQLNLYDRNYSINHTMEASNEDMDSGSPAEISTFITLSAALVSAAYHRSGQLAAAEEAVAAAKKAEIKKAKDEALARQSAAQAAAAIRPSAESEESIRKRLTKEITADVMLQLKKVNAHLNFPAAPTQSTQRDGTATRGQGRGRGRGRGGVNTSGQQGGGRGRQAPAATSTQDTRRPKSNSRGRQKSRSTSPRRGTFQSPPPPKTPRTPRVSSSPARSQSQGANGSNRGRGAKRGRGRGGPRPPRSPSPAAGRGGHGRGQSRRNTSPRPHRN